MKRKYEYGDDERALIHIALSGGRPGPAVFGGTFEMMSLSLLILGVVVQMADSEAVAKLYAKIIGNALADEKMPRKVKENLVLREFLNPLYSKNQQLFVEILKHTDLTIDAIDRQLLVDMVGPLEENRPQRRRSVKIVESPKPNRCGDQQSESPSSNQKRSRRS